MTWELSKTIPPSVILVLVIQAIYFINFQNDLNAGVSSNQAQIQRNDTRIGVLESSVQGQEVSLARIEEHLRHLRETVDRVLQENP